jgi:hypothetical protein
MTAASTGLQGETRPRASRVAAVDGKCKFMRHTKLSPAAHEVTARSTPSCASRVRHSIEEKNQHLKLMCLELPIKTAPPSPR